MEPTTKTMPDHETRHVAAEPTRAPLPATAADMQAKPARRNDPRFRMFLIAGLIVLAIVGIFVWRYLGSYESTDDAQIDGHVNSISARVAGHVNKLNVQDNQYVEAGTVLVEIDPTDYQVALQRAQADYNDAKAVAEAAAVDVPITSVSTSSQLSSADADVLNAQAGIKAARQQYEAAKANLTQAEANDVKAQNDLGRYKQLVDKQEISQQQYDQAVAASKASAAGVLAARATADAAQFQVTQAEGKLLQAEANQRSAATGPKQLSQIQARAQSAAAAALRKKADLDQAVLNLQYTKIVAPVAGIVSDRTVEVGQNVQAGQELLKVIPLEEKDLWVTANFKETQLRDMKPGQKATIYVDATGKSYKGQVDSVAGASGARFSLLPPENATGNYVKVVQRIPVKIIFEQGEIKEHELRPGMSVEPKVWIRE
jgi:membrane fusion protein (multidrug efflux system)